VRFSVTGPVASLKNIEISKHCKSFSSGTINAFYPDNQLIVAHLGYHTTKGEGHA
jgi:hypothetical protein